MIIVSVWSTHSEDVSSALYPVGCHVQQFLRAGVSGFAACSAVWRVVQFGCVPCCREGNMTE